MLEIFTVAEYNIQFFQFKLKLRINSLSCIKPHFKHSSSMWVMAIRQCWIQRLVIEIGTAELRDLTSLKEKLGFLLTRI
jgi:hypothetical protein